jgi:hypothetical protein
MSDKYLVYASPGPTSGAPWGGWHVTLAGRASYAGGLQEVMERVRSAVIASGNKWRFWIGTLRPGPHIFARLSGELRTNGVRNVKDPADHHMMLGSATEFRGAWLDLYVVHERGTDYTWYPVQRQVSRQVSPQHVAKPGKKGAGVVLLEMYNRRLTPARHAPAVILFRENGMYTDAGGACDPGESRLATAQRELKEESLGLFRIDMHKHSKSIVTVRLPTNDYTVFFVPVRSPSGIRKAMYDKNLDVVRTLGRRLPTCWRETDGMTRFYLDDLVTAGVMTRRGNLPGVSDVYGAVHTVSGRAKAAIREFMSAATALLPISISMDNACAKGLGEWGSDVYRDTRGATHCYFA